MSSQCLKIQNSWEASCEQSYNCLVGNLEKVRYYSVPMKARNRGPLINGEKQLGFLPHEIWQNIFVEQGNTH